MRHCNSSYSSILFVATFLLRYNTTSSVVAFQQQHYHWYHQQLSSRMNSIGSRLESTSSSELEIEKKFSIKDAKQVEQRLSSLGFEITHKENFVDWYFDLPAPYFSLQDCWFRYREKKVKVMNNYGWRGTWQVKKGTKQKEDGDIEDGMTVYQELQGKDAKELILNMLGDISASAIDNVSENTSSNMKFDHDIPHLEGAERLVPFARLETFRTCYRSTSNEEFKDLRVDVDTTDFGHQVGEVEAVLLDGSIADKVEIKEAKESISKLVDLISCESETAADEPSMAAIGKLEYYLMKNHRDHYDACVESGVI